MKTVILVGDGMGDEPQKNLDGKTLLQYAATPNMDWIAQHGKVSLLQTIPDGMAPGSDIANLSLLGYAPQEFYTGRSPLEAASLGVDLKENEVAFRLNLVTTRDENDTMIMVDYSGGHISTPDAHILIDALQEAILPYSGVKLYPGISYRHLVVVDFDVAELETQPPHDHTDQDVGGFWTAYSKVPVLHDFILRAQGILKDHPFNKQRVNDGLSPVNNVWLWGQGKSPEIRNMHDLYKVKGAIISAVDLLKGIGVYAGMEVLDVEGATGYLDTNYQGKVDAALASLKGNDLVFVHVEAPDETGHQGLLNKKLQAIEDFDAQIVGPILKKMQAQAEPFSITVCMDHFTPIRLKTHTRHPVPVATFFSDDPLSSGCGAYSELEVAQTGNFYTDSAEFMRTILGRE
ncbi:MAG: cofactor-independent phosphoglycerate mutase [Desulfobulbaceae bacterium]|nr:cofactor-independent phosphoglycerate mutase [Desulfobulbaceae bacterium]